MQVGKVIALCSGGVDSILLLYFLAKRYPEYDFQPLYLYSKNSGAYWGREEGSNLQIYEMYKDKFPNVLKPEHYDSPTVRVSRGRTNFRNQIYLEEMVRVYGKDKSIIGISMGTCPGQEGGSWVHGWCVTGDTIIRTSHGDFPIQELVTHDFSGDPMYAFAQDGIKPAMDKIVACKQVGSKREVFRVTLDDGSYVDGPLYHQIMMQDGSFRCISELKSGDSIRPVILGGTEKDQYPTLRGRYHYYTIHNLVMEAMIGRDLEYPKEVTHHKDHNKKNYHPSNLDLMPFVEHYNLHAKQMLGKEVPLERRQRISAKLKGKTRSSEEVQHIKEGLQRYRELNGCLVQQLPEVREKIRRTVQAGYDSGARVPAREKIGLGVRRARLGSNHKIVSVEYLGERDIFDIETQKYHNFATNNCYAHNTLDRDDHSPKFLESYLKSIQPSWALWTFGTLEPEFPEIGKKSVRVKLGVDLLGEDWLWKTTSCQRWFTGTTPGIYSYLGEGIQATGGCGECHSCAARYVAIIHAIGHDKTPYRHDPIKARWTIQYAAEYNDVPLFIASIPYTRDGKIVKRELRSFVERMASVTG